MSAGGSYHIFDSADAVAVAKTKVIDFEDIDTNPYGDAVVENGYAHLDWTNFYAVNPETFGVDQRSGFFTGLTSGEQDALGGFGRPCDVYLQHGSFTLNSVEMTAAWDKKLTVEIIGYRDGQEVAYDTVNLTDKGPLLVQLGFLGMDEVQFIPLHGKQDPKLARVGQGDQIVFDDFSISDIRGKASTAPNDHKLMGAFAAFGMHTHVDVAHLLMQAGVHHTSLAIA